MIGIGTKCAVFKVPSVVSPDEVNGNHAMYSRRISLLKKSTTRITVQVGCGKGVFSVYVYLDHSLNGHY